MIFEMLFASPTSIRQNILAQIQELKTRGISQHCFHPEMQKIRESRGWTNEELAQKFLQYCNLLLADLDRATLEVAQTNKKKEELN